jgi:predicted metallo-beta-lactamase superfamily hydrolase
MTILAFSSAGVMGWAIWKDVPLVSCVLVAGISLLRLLSPHLIPSEKQIDKLDQVIDFYCDYYNKMEQLWLNHYNERLTDQEAQKAFYKLKDTERTINKTVNEIVKSTNKKIFAKTETECINYFKRTFNI